MALKGKAKKSQKRRAKPVARPPKAALEKRSPRQRRIDVFFVLAALFVVTMVVVVVWAIIVSTRPKEIAGLAQYVESTADQRRELGNVSAELTDAAQQVRDAEAGTDLGAAYDRVSSLAPRAQSVSQALTPETQTAAPEFRTAATLLAASSQTMSQAVSVLASAQDAGGDAMSAQIARKALRIAAASDAMRTSGERAIENLQDGDDFKEQATDVAPFVPPAELQEGPPLDGILDELPAPPEGGSPTPVDTTTPIEVNLSTVPDSDYGVAVGDALGPYDRAVGNTGSVVSATETTKDYPGLQLEATKWYAATRTAFTQIAQEGRPKKSAVDDVALLNSLWLVSESSRSFASTATDSAQADAMITSGKGLRLVADELRQAAATGLAPEGVVLPSAPETGFDPTMIGMAPATPEVPPAGADGLPGGAPVSPAN